MPLSKHESVVQLEKTAVTQDWNRGYGVKSWKTKCPATSADKKKRAAAGTGAHRLTTKGMKSVHSGRPTWASGWQYTAQVVGLPELRSTAATREQAIEQARSMLTACLAAGQVVPIDVPCENLLLNFPAHLDPNDPVEKAFLDEMTRLRQQDLDRTLREHDQECPSSSSTPTT